MRNWRDNLNTFKLWIRIAAIIFTFVVMARVMTQTIGDLKSYPGIDLRAKVVGARLLIREMNPYYDPRHEIHTDHLRMLSEDTYSPALLLLYAPLCETSWNTQRIIYFYLDWASILLCFFVLSYAFPISASRVALWFAFVLIVIAGLSFRLHLERGQYYIELSLLTCLAAVCLVRRHDSWFCAFPLALLVLFRPTYAICILCLLVFRRFRLAAIASSLCLVLFALTLPFAGIRDWENYFNEIRFNQVETAGAAYAKVSAPPSATQRQIIEGVDFSHSLSYPGYLADRTLTGVAQGSVSRFLTRFLHRIASSASTLERLNSTGLSLACLSDLALMYSFSRRRVGGLVPIAFLFLAPLNLELFAPQRFAYCDVTILVPVLLLTAAVLEKSRRLGWVLFSVLLAVGALLPFLAIHFDEHAPLASFLSYVGILAILNIVCILELWKAQFTPTTHPILNRNQSGDCAA